MNTVRNNIKLEKLLSLVKVFSCCIYFQLVEHQDNFVQ